MAQNPVADVLMIAVAVLVLGPPMILIAYIAAELTRRPRFGLRSLLIAMTIAALLLGCAAYLVRRQ
jgi:hypothetical protein